VTALPVGLHPERVAGDPHAVRWVGPPGAVPAGRVRTAPGRLGELFAEGVLTRGLTEHVAVWLWLREDQSWAEWGAAVRAALSEAIAEPGGWQIDPDPAEVLGRVLTDLLDGSVGEFVRSHGGSVRFEALGDAVAVRLGGACEHCPAAGQTLRGRLLGEARRRCPDLVEADRADGTLVLSLAARD
jgi:Fe/S biogenesis protein NfuA